MDDGVEKAPFSWPRDRIDIPYNSRLFQSIILELERCMQSLETLVQEDEDVDVDNTFPNRKEKYCRKKQELLKRVRDCNRLYRSLVENIDADSSAPDSGADDPELEPQNTATGAAVSADVFRLAGESSRQLIELTRSNEEKREAIRGLVEENRRLMEERGALLQMKLTMSRSRRGEEETEIGAGTGSRARNKGNSSRLRWLRSLLLGSLRGGVQIDVL